MKKWNVSVDITMSKSIEVEAVGEEEMEDPRRIPKSSLF